MPPPLPNAACCLPLHASACHSNGERDDLLLQGGTGCAASGTGTKQRHLSHFMRCAPLALSLAQSRTGALQSPKRHTCASMFLRYSPATSSHFHVRLMGRVWFLRAKIRPCSLVLEIKECVSRSLKPSGTCFFSKNRRIASRSSVLGGAHTVGTLPGTRGTRGPGSQAPHSRCLCGVIRLVSLRSFCIRCMVAILILIKKLTSFGQLLVWL